ncbi:bacillithiol biosynthesis cysteine-adding enzyme BshC [Melioribacteraceae bacterium 4301-Me]|uniref:bacillithiol biosynthesis cysteine-adding enzyme BshC n=1 Tax=Pyranulibacter aquaticus TaxID=3163344 RepID=UPI003596DB08
MFINFAKLPYNQKLFLDYIQNNESVSKYYHRNYRDTSSYEEFFKLLTAKNNFNRENLINIIKSQYANNNPTQQTLNNIELLRSSNTLAVITGQQLGIFGGPLYTIYKIISAIKLCSNLKENFDAFNFVPIFWMEGDDHDFDEASTTSIIDNNNNVITLKYDDGQIEEQNRGSVGEILFNRSLNELLNNLSNNLRESEFKPQLMTLLKSIYTEGKTFAQSFRDLLFKLFDEYGLIIFNPLDAEVKKLLKPVFIKEITEYSSHADKLVERSAELEDAYHAQVKVKPINLFYIDNNERLLIEPTDNDYRLKGKRKKFSREELINLLSSQPERFSPNVILRPICQDYLFPTAFYIAGPSEISYFAQITPMYEIYKIAQPFIYPRASATLVEKGIKNILEKYNLTYFDVFKGEQEIVNMVISSLSELNLDAIFENTITEINSIMGNLNHNLVTIDKTLTDIIDKSKEKILQTIEAIKAKTQEAEQRKYEVAVRQVKKVSNALLPNNNLQERELNFFYFANKYGLDLLKRIYSELAINKFEHQIIEI